MYPLNDNDLDRLSREAAEQYDVQPGTSGWEALENRLNKELPRKEEKDRRRFLFWLFFIVLLAGGGLLWTMTGKKTDTTIQLTGANAVPSAGGEAKNIDRIMTAPSNETGAQKELSANTPQEHTTHDQVIKPGEGDRSAPAGTGNQLPAPSGETANATVNNRSQPLEGAKRNNTARQKKNRAQGEPTQDKTSDDGGIPTNRFTKIPRTALTAEQDPKASLVTAAGLKAGNIGAIKAPPFVMPQGAEVKQKEQKKKGNPNRGLELGLVAGPDMSNVKFTDVDKAGYNVGLQLGYRFNDHWSVNTGLLYTRKNYTAQGKDFTKPNNSWWQNREPVGLQGYCEMFDIPLYVRYDFSFNNKQRWFAGAGASSYIMTGEYYAIDYTYSGGSTVRQSSYAKDSSSTYPFSILNISAGYERKLNNRFSLQVEPYFKLPLKGLGYGKLDLNSYGIYFSARYKFGKP